MFINPLFRTPGAVSVTRNTMVVKTDRVTSLMDLTVSQRGGEYKQFIDKYMGSIIAECGMFYKGVHRAD